MGVCTWGLEERTMGLRGRGEGRGSAIPYLPAPV